MRSAQRSLTSWRCSAATSPVSGGEEEIAREVRGGEEKAVWKAASLRRAREEGVTTRVAHGAEEEGHDAATTFSYNKETGHNTRDIHTLLL